MFAAIFVHRTISASEVAEQNKMVENVKSDSAASVDSSSSSSSSSGSGSETTPSSNSCWQQRQKQLPNDANGQAKREQPKRRRF
ncbi:hypothetical protein AWZ03_005923 [Drosophila navojoa]|uniref:Uncharacterized protein n=1 Tax=Drosophila navojoa TaxID=7232 RepID=A0A484BIJ3_DRONA|nr:hypothetical protein AWZ03_005923 [Drosophila navojoa]